ncbi:hypothetical protein [Candidatus Burkholderia verschuerenii]|uniref:hypothetical protein n=1 Tax=Candidatus Burkholderia verschuerenii TaxID=242163 RepID=UPI00067B0B45|nr:hypothetical protein [Candidatus Burkholderia verschuerenii]
MCSVGCAIADPSSSECLSFCLSFPAGAEDADAIAELGDAVREQARVIGRSIGDPYWTVFAS